MRTFKKIFLLPVKLLILPLILLLKVVYILANLVTNIGTFVASPLILFVLGCGIYCAAVGRWTDVGLLAGIEVCILLVIFAATWLTEFLLDITTSLSGFLHA